MPVAPACRRVESLNLALLSLLRATPWKLSLARPMAWVIGARDCPGAGEGCNDGRVQGVGRMLRGILGSRAAKNTLLVVTVWLPADGLGNRSAVLESLRPAAERAVGLLQMGHTTCTVAADSLGKLPVAAGSALSPPQYRSARPPPQQTARERRGLPPGAPPAVAAAAPLRESPGLVVSSRPFPRPAGHVHGVAPPAQPTASRAMFEAASKRAASASPAAADAAPDLKGAPSGQQEHDWAASDARAGRSARAGDTRSAGEAAAAAGSVAGALAGAVAASTSPLEPRAAQRAGWTTPPLRLAGAEPAHGSDVGLILASLPAAAQEDQPDALATALAGLSEALLQDGLGPTAAAVAALAPPASAAGRARSSQQPRGEAPAPVPRLALSGVQTSAAGEPRGAGALAGRRGASTSRPASREQAGRAMSRLGVAESSVTTLARGGAATARAAGGLGRLSSRAAAGALLRATARPDMHAGRLLQGTERARQAHARGSSRLRATGVASLAQPPRVSTVYPQQRLTPGGALRGTLVDASCIEWPAALS